MSVGTYIPALETKRNCFAPAETAKSATGPTVSRSLPLLSTTTSKLWPAAFVASSSGFAQHVVTPAEVSSEKYENGGFCIFASSWEPTTLIVTEWPCAAKVLASQNPMFAWPPPFVLTMSTRWGATAAVVVTATGRCEGRGSRVRNGEDIGRVTHRGRVAE